MKTRPIILTPAEVLAALDGRLTLVVRPLKKQPPPDTREMGMSDCRGFCRDFPAETHDWPCPYGSPGTVLWGREPWQDYCPLWDGYWCGCGSKKMQAETHSVVYRADNPQGHLEVESRLKPGTTIKTSAKKWRPPSNMPKRASRIRRLLTSVEVRQVQSITIDDIERVGIRDGEEDGFGAGPTAVCDSGDQQFRERFAAFWDTRLAKTPRQKWEANPWAWFLRIKGG